MKRRKRHVDDLVEEALAGRPLPFAELDAAEDVEVLRAAIELRAARPAADLPSDEFVSRLRRQINIEATSADVVAGTGHRRLSRWSLLVGAGAAAVAATIGAVADRTIFDSSVPSPGVAGAVGPLVPETGKWVPVATKTDLASGRPLRFATSRVVGFVTEQGGEVVAVSGVCTHLGCLLQANIPADRLDCPCHRTSFRPDGAVLFHQLVSAPARLPKILVRTRDDTIEVFEPTES